MNKIIKIALLTSFTLAGAPLLAQAYQISPTPNPANGVINIITLDATNSVVFDNYGSLKVSADGAPEGDGVLNNNAGGILNNYGFIHLPGWVAHSYLNNNSGAILNNSGTLDNWRGYLHNYAGGTINNNFGGVISNGHFGSVINDSGATLNNNFGSKLIFGNESYISNSGTLNNSGEMSGALWGSLFNNSGGTVNINAGGTALFENLSNSSGGTININSGGTLTHFGTLAWVNNGTLNNAGTLNNGSGYDFINTGTLNNTGILANSAKLNNTGIISGIGAYIQTGTYSQTINNGTMTQTSFDFQGGSLSGTGTMNGDVTIGGLASVNPGNSPGIMTINGNFSSSGVLVFEIAGLEDGLFDVLNINGNANFNGGNIQFDFINGYDSKPGNFWDFMTANTITGWDTLGFTFNGLEDGLYGRFIQLGNETVRLVISPVPEPQTYAMLLAGLGLIGFTTLRRKQSFGVLPN